MSRFVPVEPFHPGEYISDELEARGWTQDDLAAITGITRRQIINLLKGRSAITPETALALADAFGQDAKTWMDLQVAFELAEAKQKDRSTARRASIYRLIPVKECQRRGWLEESTEVSRLEESVCKFLQIRDIAEQPQVRLAARRSAADPRSIPAQCAWYFRAKALAEVAPAAEFSDGNIGEGLRDLLSLAANPEDARRVPSLIADMGIRLVFVEAVRSSKIDGAAFWLDRNSPCIALSLRYDRIDNFWFTLLHELDHIRNRDEAPIDVDMLDDSGADDMEQRANAWAANVLIPQGELDSFILRTRPLFYRTKIVQFAQARGVHPGIVVGQLQKRGEIGFKQLRKDLAKIREFVLRQALTDGWGESPSI